MNKSTIAKPTIATFFLTVDSSQEYAKLIEAGKYDKVKGEITFSKFPIVKDEVGKMEVCLVHFGEKLSKKDAICRIAELGYRPGEVHEILSFGIEHPKKQLKGPILALGSLHKVKGEGHIFEAVYLSGDDGLREVGAIDLPDDWLDADRLGPTIRFLVIRDPQ